VKVSWLKLFVKQLFRNKKFLMILLIIALFAIKVYAAPCTQPSSETDPGPPPGGDPYPDPDPLSG